MGNAGTAGGRRDEEETLGSLDGGTTSNSSGSESEGRGRRGRPPNTSFRLLLLGVAITCTPCAKGFLTGGLDSA